MARTEPAQAEKNLSHLVRRVNEVSTLPNVMTRILSVTNNPNADVDDLSADSQRTIIFSQLSGGVHEIRVALLNIMRNIAPSSSSLSAIGPNASTLIFASIS